MSAKGGCEIITDPNLIRQIDEDAAFKSRFRSIKCVLTFQRTMVYQKIQTGSGKFTF